MITHLSLTLCSHKKPNTFWNTPAVHAGFVNQSQKQILLTTSCFFCFLDCWYHQERVLAAELFLQARLQLPPLEDHRHDEDHLHVLRRMRPHHRRHPEALRAEDVHGPNRDVPFSWGERQRYGLDHPDEVHWPSYPQGRDEAHVRWPPSSHQQVLQRDRQWFPRLSKRQPQLVKLLGCPIYEANQDSLQQHLINLLSSIILREEREETKLLFHLYN